MMQPCRTKKKFLNELCLLAASLRLQPKLRSPLNALRRTQHWLLHPLEQLHQQGRESGLPSEPDMILKSE